MSFSSGSPSTWDSESSVRKVGFAGLPGRDSPFSYF